MVLKEAGKHSGSREAADLWLLFTWAQGFWKEGWAAVAAPLNPCCLIQNISCLYFEIFEARIVGRGKINGDRQIERQTMA